MKFFIVSAFFENLSAKVGKICEKIIIFAEKSIKSDNYVEMVRKEREERAGAEFT